MPSVESFKAKKPAKTKAASKSTAKPAAKLAAAKPAPSKTKQNAKTSSKPKRRLALEGMTMLEQDSTETIRVSVVDMEGKMDDQDQNLKDEVPGFQFGFPGSELIRNRFPQSVKLTEVIVDEWLKDGQFEKLPIEHPILEVLTQKGLRQAKEMEQKFFQNPAVEKAIVQALTVGFKVQNFWAETKKKIKK